MSSRCPVTSMLSRTHYPTANAPRGCAARSIRRSLRHVSKRFRPHAAQTRSALTGTCRRAACSQTGTHPRMQPTTAAIRATRPRMTSTLRPTATLPRTSPSTRPVTRVRPRVVMASNSTQSTRPAAQRALGEASPRARSCLRSAPRDYRRPSALLRRASVAARVPRRSAAAAARCGFVGIATLVPVPAPSM